MNRRQLVTCGEHLYAYLFQFSIETKFLDRFEEKHLTFTRNSNGYRLFIQEAFAINLLKRLLYHAEKVNERFDRENPVFLKELGKIIESIGLERMNREGRLVRLTRDALSQRSRGIGDGLRKKMLQHSKRDNASCYLCGRILNYQLAQKQRDDDITLDHVWPRSLGGDSEESNLLPSCRKCNEHKKKDFPVFTGFHCGFSRNAYFIYTLLIRQEKCCDDRVMIGR
jgi:5-methylcytosine-specific restriction endonuclease McrA